MKTLEEQKQALANDTYLKDLEQNRDKLTSFLFRRNPISGFYSSERFNFPKQGERLDAIFKEIDRIMKEKYPLVLEERKKELF